MGDIDPRLKPKGGDGQEDDKAAALVKFLQEANRGPLVPELDPPPFRHLEVSTAKFGSAMRCHVPPEPARFQGGQVQLGDLNQKRELMMVLDKREPRREAKEVARKEIEKFEKQTPLERSITVLSRMPEQASLRLDKDKLTLETRFGKLLEAVPGVKLDSKAAQLLSKIKSITLEGDKFTASLLRPTTIDGFEMNLHGFKVGELQAGTARNPKISFNVVLDPKNESAALTNIEGLTVSAVGGLLRIPVNKLEIKNIDGKQSVVTSFGFGAASVENVVSADSAFQGIRPGVLKSTIEALSDLKAVLNSRDLGKFAELVPEASIRDAYKSMFKGLVSIEKHGDQFRIMRDNGDISYDLKGPRIVLGTDLKFRVGRDPERPSLSEISGLSIDLPLPEEMRLGSRYKANIKSASFGLQNKDGSRLLSVEADNMVEQLRVKVTKDMLPLTDSAGNFELGLRIKNPLSSRSTDKMDVNLRLDKHGQPNMLTSEIADIISRMTWQASDLSISGAGLTVISAGSKMASWAASAYNWLFD